MEGSRLRFEDEIESIEYSLKHLKRKLQSPDRFYKKKAVPSSPSKTRRNSVLDLRSDEDSRPKNPGMTRSSSWAPAPSRSSSARERLKQKVDACRTSDDPDVPLLYDSDGNAIVNVLALTNCSVAAELRKQTSNNNILKSEDVARFCRDRERQEKLKILNRRTYSAPNFPVLNRDVKSALPAVRHRARLLGSLERCVRADAARLKRLEEAGAYKQRAYDAYLTRQAGNVRSQVGTDKIETSDHDLGFAGCSEMERYSSSSKISFDAYASSAASSADCAAEAVQRLEQLLPRSSFAILTDIRSQQQLCTFFRPEGVEFVTILPQVVARRVTCLLENLRSWIHRNMRCRAVEVLKDFLLLSTPIGLQMKIKLATQRLAVKVKLIQQTWRLFHERLCKVAQHILHEFWHQEELDLLERVFTRCPLDREVIVGLPRLLNSEAQVPHGSADPLRPRSASTTALQVKSAAGAKRVLPPWKPSGMSDSGASATKTLSIVRQRQNEEVAKILDDAFREKVRQKCSVHRFQNTVATSIVRREIIERLYWQATTSFRPPDMGRSGFPSFGLGKAARLTTEDVRELLFASHRGQGVRPVDSAKCQVLLPAADWYVNAWKRFLAGQTRTIREGLVDRGMHNARLLNVSRTIAVSESLAETPESSVSQKEKETTPIIHSLAEAVICLKKKKEEEEENDQRTLRKSLSSSILGASSSSRVFANARCRPHSAGNFRTRSSQQFFKGELPPKVAPSMETRGRQRRPSRMEDFPSQRASMDLPTNEAGWPSPTALLAPAVWPSHEQVVKD